jgi:site-specific DNA-methyltransferase (adenine-specific)
MGVLRLHITLNTTAVADFELINCQNNKNMNEEIKQQEPTTPKFQVAEVSTSPSIQFFNVDCLEHMRSKSDKFYDFAIVDPEYGKDAANMTMGKGLNKKWNKKDWDKKTPDKTYFDELFRVSKNQIIFGGNYFDLPKTGGWLFWDKNKQKDVSFADGELAWTNFLNNLKKITVRYDGFIGSDSVRIHPTQKPILLYRYLLTKYVSKGMKILDTHGGSMTHAIACDLEGFDLDICEIDPEYFSNGVKAYEMHKRQQRLF